jgi:Arc/MetJ-type ribon-helix-helix transcriptional regulator
VKTLQIELPDQLARELESAVAEGRFHSAAEFVRAALREYLRSRRFEVLEKQQLHDIAWALRENVPQQ